MRSRIGSNPQMLRTQWCVIRESLNRERVMEASVEEFETEVKN